jgi:hypothetical protein
MWNIHEYDTAPRFCLLTDTVVIIKKCCRLEEMKTSVTYMINSVPFCFIFTPALGPTQPPVQWVPGVLSPGVKARPGRDADHSPPSSAEVENE